MGGAPVEDLQEAWACGRDYMGRSTGAGPQGALGSLVVFLALLSLAPTGPKPHTSKHHLCCTWRQLELTGTISFSAESVCVYY